MSCIWSIPKKERHCDYCNAMCDEREIKTTYVASNTATEASKILNNTIIIGGNEFFIINGDLVLRTL